MNKTKIVKCLASVAVIGLCIVISNIIKDTSNRMVKDFDLSLFEAYSTIIGSIICLVVGLSIGYIIRSFAKIENQRVLFRVFVGITIACMVCMTLIGIDMLFINRFSTGFADFISTTFGVYVSVFILQNGRFVFILLGLLDMLFWSRGEGKKSLMTTMSIEQKNKVEERLRNNDIWFDSRIKHLDKARNIGARSTISPTNFGETVASIEYSIFVKKADYEKAKHLT